MPNSPFSNIDSICEATNTNISVQNYCSYCETDPFLQDLNNKLNKYISHYNKLITILHEEKLSVNHQDSKKQEELIDQVNKLNNMITTILHEINEKINTIDQDNISIQDKIIKTKKKLKENKQKYDFHAQAHKNSYKINQNILGQYEDRKLRRISEKYTFFAWFLLTLAILAITVYSIQHNSKNIYENAVVLIICLLCVYGAARWLYRKI